ncbi:TRAP transporter small permease [Alcaligenes endophyticus]|uniref:TRAP transporter small permease protein n=1 Tax=Alcaligenes endophyticus TaxID=1929088 RepID=A0ABT8EI76_9BURK|nr:TRAP transporter small permease [Alcaligenes endophyticus]MCX5592664.1 TRAP transporter small permease [Alcaligenes endophyticus]MDN4120988.1 TRAP transporter small permease [Alcaligenes endophyticus]
MRALQLVNKFLEWVATVAVAVVMVLVLVQIFYRYVMNDPIGWTQEMSVFATMLVVMLGAAIAFRRNEHIAVTFFVDLFPRPIQLLLTVLANLVTMGFLGMLSYQSWLLSKRAMMQVSPTTGIPVGVVVLFVTIGCALSVLYLIPRLLHPSVRSTEEEALAELNQNQ